MFQVFQSFVLVTVFNLVLFGCSSENTPSANAKPEAEVADMVLQNAYVYTVDKNLSVHQAVAIKGNKIIYVGDNRRVKAHIGERTDVLDLQGRMLMPGLHDMHIHAAGIVELDMCDFKGQAYSL